jgi:hypothetical protein
MTPYMINNFERLCVFVLTVITERIKAKKTETSNLSNPFDAGYLLKYGFCMMSL